MTISEACEKALIDLGGRAHLSEIYPRVLKMVKLTGATPTNSIRTEMKNHPLLFRHSPNKPRGWWELTSYQEEVAELKSQIVELTAKNELLTAIPKEADFVESFLKEVMNEYKRRRGEADPIRNILRHMRHEDAAAVLDAWIDEKEDELAKALKKIAERPTTQNIYGDKNEFKEDSKLLKLALPADVDPAEIALRIAEQQKQIEKKKNNKSGKSAK